MTLIVLRSNGKVGKDTSASSSRPELVTKVVLYVRIDDKNDRLSDISKTFPIMHPH